MPERIMRTATVYEVLQGRTVVCSWKMGLTKHEAQNKVDNERRTARGSLWSIRPVRVQRERK